MATVGYVRVSSVDQHLDRQLAGVDVDKLFTDKTSGKNTDRPGLQAALNYLREGDVFVVHSMDRLARNLDDLRQMVRDLTSEGITVKFIKEGLEFTNDQSPMSMIMLSLIGAVAEFERALILERQREGIAIARAKGKYQGSKPKLARYFRAEIRKRVTLGESPSALAKEYGVSRATIYVYCKEKDEKADAAAAIGRQAMHMLDDADGADGAASHEDGVEAVPK